MAYKRSESLKELVLMQEEMELCYAANSSGNCCRWSPTVDLFETDESILLNVELPGMDEKDIKVEVNGGVVTIEGARLFRGIVEENSFLCLERNYGAFKRSFRLPMPVIKNEVQAELKLGVLKIIMPKEKAPNPKQIEVNIG